MLIGCILIFYLCVSLIAFSTIKVSIIETREKRKYLYMTRENVFTIEISYKLSKINHTFCTTKER